MTQQEKEQRLMGWEHLVWTNTHYLCKWHTKNDDKEEPAFLASLHGAFSSAGHANETCARLWKQQGPDYDYVQTLVRGTWELSKNGEVIVCLSLDYITKDTPLNLTLEKASKEGENERRKRFNGLLDFLRQRGREP